MSVRISLYKGTICLLNSYALWLRIGSVQGREFYRILDSEVFKRSWEFINLKNELIDVILYGDDFSVYVTPFFVSQGRKGYSKTSISSSMQRCTYGRVLQFKSF